MYDYDEEATDRLGPIALSLLRHRGNNELNNLEDDELPRLNPVDGETEALQLDRSPSP